MTTLKTYEKSAARKKKAAWTAYWRRVCRGPCVDACDVCASDFVSETLVDGKSGFPACVQCGKKSCESCSVPLTRGNDRLGDVAVTGVVCNACAATHVCITCQKPVYPAALICRLCAVPICDACDSRFVCYVCAAIFLPRQAFVTYNARRKRKR